MDVTASSWLLMPNQGEMSCKARECGASVFVVADSDAPRAMREQSINFGYGRKPDGGDG
jgi:hypothetical protein